MVEHCTRAVVEGKSLVGHCFANAENGSRLENGITPEAYPKVL